MRAVATPLHTEIWSSAPLPGSLPWDATRRRRKWDRSATRYHLSWATPWFFRTWRPSLSSASAATKPPYAATLAQALAATSQNTICLQPRSRSQEQPSATNRGSKKKTNWAFIKGRLQVSTSRTLGQIEEYCWADSATPRDSQMIGV